MKVDLSAREAMEQAAMTARHYLSKACDILEDEYSEYSMVDAIELTKVMAQDFHTAMMCMKMQEIKDAIYELDIR